jgi:glutathione synthase/RimK-type ligase-like ATP-grasp enzyme
MKIIILTNNKGFFGQMYQPWEGVDLENIVSLLTARYNVERMTFFEVANRGPEVFNDAFVLYSSSQQMEYKEYILDVLMYIEQLGAILLPSLNMFKSHENKGFQELHKKLVGVKSLNGIYAARFDEVECEDLKFPLIYKNLNGSGSGGVSLVKNIESIKKLSFSDECFLSRTQLSLFKGKLKAAALRVIGISKSVNNYGDYFAKQNRFILQEYVDRLSYDYKVIIFADKYFILKRYVEKGDFRASGSGLFEHIFEINESLLYFCKNMFIKFNEPFLALDVCEKLDRCHLIEYQGVHFGPYTVIKSKGYFKHDETLGWKYILSKSNLEENIFDAVNLYIEKNIS